MTGIYRGGKPQRSFAPRRATQRGIPDDLNVLVMTYCGNGQLAPRVAGSCVITPQTAAPAFWEALEGAWVRPRSHRDSVRWTGAAWPSVKPGGLR